MRPVHASLVAPAPERGEGTCHTLQVRPSAFPGSRLLAEEPGCPAEGTEGVETTVESHGGDSRKGAHCGNRGGTAPPCSYGAVKITRHAPQTVENGHATLTHRVSESRHHQLAHFSKRDDTECLFEKDSEEHVLGSGSRPRTSAAGGRTARPGPRAPPSCRALTGAAGLKDTRHVTREGSAFRTPRGP